MVSLIPGVCAKIFEATLRFLLAIATVVLKGTLMPPYLSYAY